MPSSLDQVSRAMKGPITHAMGAAGQLRLIVICTQTDCAWSSSEISSAWQICCQKSWPIELEAVSDLHRPDADCVMCHWNVPLLLVNFS